MPHPLPGRGSAGNVPNRFERLRLDPSDIDPSATRPAEVDPADLVDDWRPQTAFYDDNSRSVISRNTSPDVPFETSLNPYRGCEHGCAYCYARPTHEYLGLSAGLDFETKVVVKRRAPELLRDELANPRWVPQTLVLSGVTDPYQPIERSLEITRRCLAVLAGCGHPVSLITKNAMVTRDADLLEALARDGAAAVAVSVTTLDEEVRRRLEPRTATADLRLDAVARLNARGIPAGVMVAPVIPGLNDHEIPRILARAAEAGARFAGYVMLRLPHAVAPLFDAWLERHYPDRRGRILDRIRDVRGGAVNDPDFGSRMRGTGPSADLVARLFRVSRDRARIPAEPPPLSVAAFRRPGGTGRLF